MRLTCTLFLILWAFSASMATASPSARSAAPAARTPRSAAPTGLARRPARQRTVGPSDDPRAALPRHFRDRVVFGVMGGAGNHVDPAVRRKLAALGRAIARAKGNILTGAAPGYPDIPARAAERLGAGLIGISPHRTLRRHRESGAPSSFDVIKLTEHPALAGQDRPNYMGREVDNIEHSDVIIVAGGRFGTLGELAIALDERRPVGVLLGTGGISNLVRDIVDASARAGKPAGAPVVYDHDPVRLVTRLLTAYRAHLDAGGVKGPMGDVNVPSPRR